MYSVCGGLLLDVVSGSELFCVCCGQLHRDDGCGGVDMHLVCGRVLLD
jgi:hypothetical protein